MKIKLDKTDSKVVHSNETYNVIDNTNLFSRMKLLKPLAWVLKQSAKQILIDPHYTRFDSELEIQLDSLTKKGYGVLEIMDLK